MKKILIALGLIGCLSLFAEKIGELIPVKELKELEKTLNEEQLKQKARDIRKNAVDLEKLKKDVSLQNELYFKEMAEKRNGIIKDFDNLQLNEYCFENITLTTARGDTKYLDLCFAIDKKVNEFFLKNLIINLTSDRSVEELSTPGGKNLFKDEIKFSLVVEKLLWSKFTFKNTPCLNK